MKLTKESAKDIVDQVMEVIPYNINIMNEKGIIIGSGDKSRLNQYHKGAIEALEKQKSIEISYMTKGEKPGINIPILFQEKAIGVIGITGHPDIVRSFGELVRVMVELLVNQNYILNQQNIKKEQKEEFLYELAYKNDKYTDKFIERGLLLGIDLSIPRVVVVIESEEGYMKKIKNSFSFILKDMEYYLNIEPEKTVLFLDYNSNIIKRLRYILEKNKNIKLRIGLGRRQNILARSLEEGLKALEIGKKIEVENKIHEYEELYFFAKLSRFSEDRKFVKINKILRDEKHKELLNTLVKYIRYNGEINKVARNLHIHRNTLSYRLEKVREITGKDPYKYKDLLELFIGYIVSEL